MPVKHLTSAYQTNLFSTTRRTEHNPASNSKTYEKLPYFKRGFLLRRIVMSDESMDESPRGIPELISAMGLVQLVSMHFEHTMVNARLACPTSTRRSEHTEALSPCAALKNSLILK
ncbi:hypothetical protein N7G274_004798 [Stereocaulon virgatum]|uniref:Uncharacterized protein n=1 Tax=Stereocaulon virgatum TaxID=373712 RepID=A0ABR4AA14_9LECA